MKIEEKFEDALYGEMYGLIYFFIEEMSGCRGEEEIRKICRKIYKNRKKLGLFTKQDIEIDEEFIMHILLNALAKLQNEHFQQMILARSSSRMCGKNYQVADFLAKAIADKKPILIKGK